ncbi:malonate--CoA ligase [Tepidimonas taiwanensis]|uniref:malonate--CoA ligase n=1 Tax=Tepidimonas taiwanensis TaxID=307486 RepID=UPI0005BDA14D|nr:malonyl-CoA synthase [Tepidimonas taiwanensis]
MTVNNLYDALRAAFPADLDTWAIETDDGLVYTWRDLERGSAMIANLLQRLDLPAGSRVVAQVDKSVEALMLYLATLRAGLVYVPLNTAYQPAEVAYFIGDAEPAVVVCTPDRFGWVSKLGFRAGARAVYTLGADRSGTLLDRAVHQPDVQTPVPVGLGALASIIYTSGTTGRSKGAMLTHGNLLANAEVLRTYWGWRADDVLIHVLPIFHVHGLFVAVHGALLNGGPMLWAAKFDPHTVLQWLPRATVFMGVPTLYTRLLAEPALTPERCAHMRLFISGSAPLLIETFRAWTVRTGHTILERYGMSETIMLTSNPYGPDARYGGQAERRGGTVGFPLPGVEVRIADDADRALSAGEVGGVQVRGPSVFQGYWRMPEKTRAEFTADGWFRTGDVGFFDERGYLTLVGRSKDLIISGGYNVYPAEVEGAINELPGVAESAVIGVPHPDFGEVGVAVVIAQPGQHPDPEAILAALRQRLANYKIPKRCFLVDELPRNAMGKVQKNVLRERYRDTFAAA